MFEVSEVYFIVFVVISVIVSLLTPVVREHLNKFYKYLVFKLGKPTADALKALFLASLKLLPILLDRVIKSKKVKDKVTEEDVDAAKKGYKKGKDILK